MGGASGMGGSFLMRANARPYQKAHRENEEGRRDSNRYGQASNPFHCDQKVQR